MIPLLLTIFASDDPCDYNSCCYSRGVEEYKQRQQRDGQEEGEYFYRVEERQRSVGGNPVKQQFRLGLFRAHDVGSDEQNDSSSCEGDDYQDHQEHEEFDSVPLKIKDGVNINDDVGSLVVVVVVFINVDVVVILNDPHNE